MQFQHSYVKQLESLILDTLLPVYANYNTKNGIKDRYAGIHPELLKQIKAKKPLAALLKPKENQT